jgi:hypothetical protein
VRDTREALQTMNPGLRFSFETLFQDVPYRTLLHGSATL